MALFSRSKKTDTAGSAQPTKKAAATDVNLASVIIKPRITEKAIGKNDQNVYTFEVRKDATKYDVADAVKHLFQ